MRQKNKAACTMFGEGSDEVGDEGCGGGCRGGVFGGGFRLVVVERRTATTYNP